MSGQFRFLAFAVEYYRSHHALTGREVADLFTAHGIYQLILDNYYLYHIESPDNMVAEIDHYIKTGRLLEA